MMETDYSFWREFKYGSLRSNKTFRDRYNSPPPSPGSLKVASDGYLPNLRALISVLESSSGLKIFKNAYRENMTYKIQKYSEMHKAAEREVTKELEVINIEIPELKSVASASDSDNWNIFESVSEQYRYAKAKAAQFERLKLRAQDKMSGSMSLEQIVTNDTAKQLRDDLVNALKSLTTFSFSQPRVVKKIVDIVASFLKNPKLFRLKLLNIMLVGGAGTGKTSLAKEIGKVFASAGLFVSGEVIEAGRAELIGQYEGQTVARTRNFLVSNLDNGVIFIDEAYAITPWDKGKPEGYGSEAATAMVEFMTQYIGLYCIIVAGYEKQMVRYFLETNEGLNRRFPNKFVLEDMSPDDLIIVFQRKLLEIQGIKVPHGRDQVLESEQYFTKTAWTYLKNLITESMRGETLVFEKEDDDATRKQYNNVRKFMPKWPLMYSIFENQAGSMVNLADEAVTVLMTRISFDDVNSATRKGTNLPPINQQQVDVMKIIVEARIQSSALSMAIEFTEELNEIEKIIL